MTHLTLYVTKTTTYNACFTKKITKPDFMKLNIYKNNKLNEINNPTAITATIPYCIKGTSEIRGVAKPL